jgi:hypothetical protein
LHFVWGCFLHAHLSADRARLASEKNEREAAQFINERIKDIVVNGTVASGPL